MNLKSLTKQILIKIYVRICVTIAVGKIFLSPFPNEFQVKNTRGPERYNKVKRIKLVS